MTDTPKQFESGFNAKPMNPGDTDLGMLVPPGWLWLTRIRASWVEDGSRSTGWRLVWGEGEVLDAEHPPDGEGELWLTDEQIQFLVEQHRIMSHLT